MPELLYIYIYTCLRYSQIKKIYSIDHIELEELRMEMTISWFCLLMDTVGS